MQVTMYAEFSYSQGCVILLPSGIYNGNEFISDKYPEPDSRYQKTEREKRGSQVFYVTRPELWYRNLYEKIDSKEINRREIRTTKSADTAYTEDNGKNKVHSIEYTHISVQIEIQDTYKKITEDIFFKDCPKEITYSYWQ